KLLQRRLGVTVLFVTHDQVEALSLSDRVAVMRGGRVEQVGPPRELYERPASAFVRDFLGQTVTLRGTVKEHVGQSGGVALDGALMGSALRGLPSGDAALTVGTAAQLAIRPEDIDVTLASEPASDNALAGTIEALLFVGDRYEARIALGGDQRVLLLLSRSRAWREGQRVRLGFPADLVSVWPA